MSSQWNYATVHNNYNFVMSIETHLLQWTILHLKIVYSQVALEMASLEPSHPWRKSSSEHHKARALVLLEKYGE